MAIRKIYRPKEVDEIFGWSPSTRKRKVKSGEMKPPMRYGPNMTGWTEEYLEELREQFIAASAEYEACAAEAAALAAAAEDVEAEEARAAKKARGETEDEDEEIEAA